MENIYIIAIYSILLLLYIEVKDYFLRKHINKNINERNELIYERIEILNVIINENFKDIKNSINKTMDDIIRYLNSIKGNK